MPRRILLITAGETPQLVTETVYALLKRTPQPWIPDEVLIATTASGAEVFERGREGKFPLPPLLGSKGRLKQLYFDLGLSDVHAEPELILTRARSGAICPDIRSESEVSAFAQVLLNRVRAITADDDTELHLSIAGGRKTMSFIAGQVMSLCGRPCDELSHCLVDPPELESGNFWWPSNDGDVASRSARINLHAVPVIRLGAFVDLDDILPDGPANYEEAVARANAALAADSILADFNDRTVLAGALRLQFTHAREFAAFVTILLATKQGAKLARKRVPYLFDEKPELKTILTWNDDERQFNLMFALCWQLLQLNNVYEGFPDSVTSTRLRLYDKVETQARGFIYADFNIPVSSAKTQIHVRYEAELARRLLHKTGKALPQCSLAPDKIAIRLPYDLDFEELIAELAQRCS